LVFPTDPSPAVSSISGTVHRWAAIFFFPCLSAAGVPAGQAVPADPGWDGSRRSWLRLSMNQHNLLAAFGHSAGHYEPDMLPFLDS